MDYLSLLGILRRGGDSDDSDSSKDDHDDPYRCTREQQNRALECLAYDIKTNLLPSIIAKQLPPESLTMPSEDKRQSPG